MTKSFYSEISQKHKLKFLKMMKTIKMMTILKSKVFKLKQKTGRETQKRSRRNLTKSARNLFVLRTKPSRKRKRMCSSKKDRLLTIQIKILTTCN